MTKDIERIVRWLHSKRLPPCLIILTSHTQQALRGGIGNGGGQGYAVLMPDYVKSKSYYRSGAGAGEWVDFLILPDARYDYDHFDGKGYEESPFKVKHTFICT